MQHSVEPEESLAWKLQGQTASSGSLGCHFHTQLSQPSHLRPTLWQPIGVPQGLGAVYDVSDVLG